MTIDGALIPDNEHRRSACNPLTTSVMQMLSPGKKHIKYYGPGGVRVMPADPELVHYDNKQKNKAMKELRIKLTKA